MGVSGRVCDTSKDGDGVYGRGRILGYDWSSKRGDSNGSAPGCGIEDRVFYSGDVRYVSYGWYQVCTDDFGRDTCDTSSKLNR